jgi:hypothetical protein
MGQGTVTLPAEWAEALLGNQSGRLLHSNFGKITTIRAYFTPPAPPPNLLPPFNLMLGRPSLTMTGMGLRRKEDRRGSTARMELEEIRTLPVRNFRGQAAAIRFPIPVSYQTRLGFGIPNSLSWELARGTLARRKAAG